ncbi:hypothetical protein C2S53_018322 [Perilla frutescens var. hirtella]|uniref:Uncharacterized protein n=1 Tax=Perilla frutescens var. hirtella TaxID=608512 RepID=A0AAD4IW44_PERFH|nr:hypothetical protein C2S53_018322 [Perilla frutescens var. hirtella]
MMNVKQTIHISESGSADERSILRQSHPPHRGHHVGVGPILPLLWFTFGEETSSSTDASTTSTIEDRARIRRLEETVLDLVDVLRQLAPDRLPPHYTTHSSTANDDLDDESV